jgi:GTP cyclohydrolase IA
MVVRMLDCIGEDVHRDGLIDTPKRVAKAIRDSVVGYALCISSVIGSAVFHEPAVLNGSGGVVLVRNIEFASTCCDTLMPFHGHCHIAYLPSQPLVIGLSKLARLVYVHSKRICSQQELTDGLHMSVSKHTSGCDVYVFTQAYHLASAANPSISSCTCVSGCFADRRNSRCQEVHTLLELAGTSAAQTTPAQSAQGINVPSGPQPVCAARATALAEAMHGVYTAALPADAPSVSPLAAAAYAKLLLHQTRGYAESLGEIVARYADTASMHSGKPIDPVVEPVELSRALEDCTPSLTVSQEPMSPSSSDTNLVGTVTAPPSSISPLESAAQRLCGSSGSESDDFLGGPASRIGLRVWNTFCSGRVVQCNMQLREAGLWGVEGACDTGVQVWRIRFASLCEHHLLPFYGSLCVCVRDGCCVAPGLLRDVVDMYCCRLQIQERVTHLVADAMHDVFGPRSEVCIVVDSAHMCMVARGVEQHSSSTMTIANRSPHSTPHAENRPDLLQLMHGALRELPVEFV